MKYINNINKNLYIKNRLIMLKIMQFKKTQFKENQFKIWQIMSIIILYKDNNVLIIKQNINKNLIIKIFRQLIIIINKY